MTTLREDPRALRPGEEPVLLTARHLLRHLKADRATVVEQREAVAEWLTTHEANRVLALSLRRHGFPPRRRSRASAA